MVSLGLGGVLVEILADQHLRLAPLSERAATSLLGAVADGRLVTGRRAISSTASRAIIRILTGIGQLIAGEPAIAEIDLNPVIVSGDLVTAADALIVTGA
jgi:acetyltransferase